MSADDTPAAVPSALPQPAPAARGGAALALFACLLGALALGASGWLYLQAAAIDARLQGQDGRLAELAVPREDPRLPALEQAAAALAKRQDEGAARAAALGGRLDALEATVGAMAKADRTDWALAEAEYLERLANQRLLMAREVRGSIALLEAADAILRDLDDPRLHAARAAAAIDIASLRAVAEFDVEGIHNRLAALGAQVPALELQARSAVGGDAAPAAEPADDAWSRLQAVLARFVIVRQRSHPVRPLLPPAEEQQARMAIRLAIEQAKLALLAAEPKVYAAALAEARASARTAFGAEASANRAFLAELDALATIDIAPTLPSISGSLDALRAHIAALHGGQVAAPAAPVVPLPQVPAPPAGNPAAGPVDGAPGVAPVPATPAGA